MRRTRGIWERTINSLKGGAGVACAAATSLFLLSGCGDVAASQDDAEAEKARETAEVEQEDLLWSNVLPGGDRTPEFAARRCVVRPDDSVQIRTTWAAANGDHPGDDGSRDETWTAGRSFGAEPNTGYTNRDRTIVNGSPLGRQPGTLGCWQGGFLAIGWKYSNNVAGLTNSSTVHQRTSRRSNETGVITRNELRGSRVDTYADPAGEEAQSIADQVAQAAEVADPAELARGYYDESAAGGRGLAWFRRSVRLGSSASPMSYRVVRVHSETQPNGQVLDAKLATERDRPLTETVIHSLVRGRPAIARTVHSGTFNLVYGGGAVVRTEVSELRFARPAGDLRPPFPGACAARSGRINHTISRAWNDYPGLVAQVRETFNGNRHTFRVTCNQGLSAKTCESRGLAALKKFGPPACMF